ncbi:MAG: phage virion morphogenesis protein [Bacteroidetes bacterium]|nr:phage virion morphogenesis protein [Bacteroidota bacterium]
MIEVQIKNALDDAVKQLQRKFEDITPILHKIVALIQMTIERNFIQHGRWSGQTTNIDLFSGGSQTWTKWSKGYNPTKIRPYAAILSRSGVMQQQIEVLPQGKTQVSISANTPYAAAHQFGVTFTHPGGTPYIVLEDGAHFISKKKAAELEAEGRKVKYTGPHQVTIPPRPFIVLTEDDVNEIAEVIKKFI